MRCFWTDKTVIAYIALAHHTRFILPVMERLKNQGARIKYIVGQAERSQEVTAIEMGLTYAHILDYVTPDDTREIHRNYSRLRRSFSLSLKNSFLFALQPVTVTDKTLYATAAEYTGFRNLMAIEKPDLCFALHELNRWGKMFAFWAKKRNVPFITLQEGLTYGLDFGYSGHAQYSSLSLVWGDRVKKKMVGFEAPESKILPVGNTHIANEIRFQKVNQIRETKRKAFGVADHTVPLLILSSILPSPDLFFPIFTAVAQTSRMTLIVKFHPACKKPQTDQWIAAIPEPLRTDIRFVHTDESMYDLISVADVCILGQRSTTGLEAVAFDKPLVKLDSAYTPDNPYSFVDQGVARKMSADECARELKKGTDFSAFIDRPRRERFLAQELYDPTNAVDRVCTVFEQIISANRNADILPLTDPAGPTNLTWSIFVPVPDNPDLFLSQIEAVAANSENCGAFETIFLEPENTPADVRRILDTLTGEVTRIPLSETRDPASVINAAAAAAKGQVLIFLDRYLAPLNGWLDVLGKGMAGNASSGIFGGRICSRQGKIAHAGLVVDRNHTPVSAYRHLDMDFPGVRKQRSFQMLDHCVVLKKSVFVRAGGFSSGAGNYRFMDLCLKIDRITDNKDAVMYLPELKLIFLDTPPDRAAGGQSIYFYGRWHGTLWESETHLHEKDGFSPRDLDQARVTAAMRSSG